MKYLAYFAIIGNAFAFISYGIICYFIFTDDRLNITTEGREAFGDISEFPLFLGIVIFATSAVYILIPLENSMKTPKACTDRFGVLNTAFSLVIVVYVLIGVLGYLKYGACVDEVITLNLPDQNV